MKFKTAHLSGAALDRAVAGLHEERAGSRGGSAKSTCAKVQTSELTDLALDWAVATIEYPDDTQIKLRLAESYIPYGFTTDWARSGPVIERESLCVRESAVASPAIAELVTPDKKWFAYATRYPDGCVNHCLYGHTYLEAAMRCFVASRMGDVVDVPQELCNVERDAARDRQRG